MEKQLNLMAINGCMLKYYKALNKKLRKEKGL